MAVFVLDRSRNPLMPCSEKRARLLLQRKRAVVHRRYPFTSRLKERIGGELQPIRLKIDPGANTTGIAIVREDEPGQHVLHLAEIQHRGKAVRKHMQRRAAFRRRRRSANLSTARGGTNRVSNLTLACQPCNQAKGSQPVEEFLAKQPEVLRRVLAQARKPLSTAAAVNAVRWSIVEALRRVGLPLELGTGGRTKWNRTRLGVPTSHCLDAVCVGEVKEVCGWERPVLAIGSVGRGSYQRTRLTACGFPRGYLMRAKWVRGFRTGDHVRATVPSGKKSGVYVGRVAVRATGSFNIQTPTGVVEGIGARYCELLGQADGYTYRTERRSAASSHC